MRVTLIFALIVILALVGCKTKNSNQTPNNTDSSKNVQAAKANNEVEPILKYGHVFSGDCAATSLDWPGNYMGAVANQANGIARLRLSLNKDWTYSMKVMALQDLQNGSVKEKLQKEVSGTFTFDKTGQIIKLIGSNHPLTNDMISVAVGESSLSVLDGNLKPLSNDGDMNALYK
jgi:hypothetical protein